MDPIYQRARFWGRKDLLFVFVKLFVFFEKSLLYATLGIKEKMFDDSKSNDVIQ
jgi:hypothetical protein